MLLVTKCKNASYRELLQVDCSEKALQLMHASHTTLAIDEATPTSHRQGIDLRDSEHAIIHAHAIGSLNKAST